MKPFVQGREPACGHLPLHGKILTPFGTAADYRCRHVLSVDPHAAPDVFLVDLKIESAIGPASNYRMGMRVIGVVMNDREPLEIGPKGVFDAADSATSEPKNLALPPCRTGVGLGDLLVNSRDPMVNEEGVPSDRCVERMERKIKFTSHALSKLPYPERGKVRYFDADLSGHCVR